MHDGDLSDDTEAANGPMAYEWSADDDQWQLHYDDDQWQFADDQWQWHYDDDQWQWAEGWQWHWQWADDQWQWADDDQLAAEYPGAGYDF